MGKDARGAERVEKLWLKRETERRAKKAAAGQPAPPRRLIREGPGTALMGKSRPG